MFIKLMRVDIRSGEIKPIRVKYDNIDYFFHSKEIIGSGTPPTFMDVTYVAMNSENSIYVMETPEEVENAVMFEVNKYQER